MTMKTFTVKCPHCEKNTVYSPENPWRPFCSEHCRALDFGAWANDDYLIVDKNETSSFEINTEPSMDNYTDDVLPQNKNSRH